MCQFCGNHQADHESSAPRRDFLKLAGSVVIGLAFAQDAFSAKPKKPPKPPKPQNVVSPDVALELLIKGNNRYAQGVAELHDFRHEREALVSGQNPYAGILSCSDSRIAPEYAFDAARGDLFVVRVAGNFVNEDGIASLEYAVQFLGTPPLSREDAWRNLALLVGHGSARASSGPKPRSTTASALRIIGRASAYRPCTDKLFAMLLSETPTSGCEAPSNRCLISSARRYDWRAPS